MTSSAITVLIALAFLVTMTGLTLINGAWVTARLDRFYDRYIGWAGKQLDDLYIEFSPVRFFWFHMIGVALVFLLMLLYIGWIGAAVTAAGSYFIPRFMLNRARRKRMEKFDTQLIDALQSMANSMRAGLVLTQAMTVVADSMEPPINQEFRLMLKEHKLGLTLEEALVKMGSRLQSRFFDMVMSSILITRQHGGNVPQVFEDTAEAIREIFRLEEKIKTMTAQGKLQGYVIGLMPAAFAFAVYLIDPEYIGELFTDPKGYVIIFLILAFEAVGVFFIRKILAADV